MIRLLLVLAAVCAYGQTCAPCHNEQIADFGTHKHPANGLNCTTCHGASEKHRTSNGESAPDRVAGPEEMPALCGGCHAKEKADYVLSKHGLQLSNIKVRTANCATCHGQHAQRPWKAVEAQCARCHADLPESCKQPPKAEARVTCMGCHARHTLAVAKK